MSTFRNGYSSLLAGDEHDTLFWLIGEQSKALSSTVAQMYICKYNQEKWQKHFGGVICLVKDNRRKCKYIQMYCLTKKKKLWEQEVTDDLNYTVIIPPTHMFESEDFKVALNFRNDEEADEFKRTVCGNFTPIKSTMPSSPKAVDVIDGKQEKPVLVQTESLKDVGCFPSKQTKYSFKPNIGPPKNFQHNIHISVNEEDGLNVKGDINKLKQFIIDAGVADNIDLTNNDIKETIYKFFEQNGGIQTMLRKHTKGISKSNESVYSDQVRQSMEEYLKESTYKPINKKNEKPYLPPKRHATPHQSFDYDSEYSDYDNLKSWETLYNKKKNLSEEHVSSKFDPLDYDIPNENPRSVTDYASSKFDPYDYDIPNENPRMVTPVKEKPSEFDLNTPSKPQVPSKANVLRKLSSRSSEKSKNGAEEMEKIINDLAKYRKNEQKKTESDDEEDYDYL